MMTYTSTFNSLSLLGDKRAIKGLLKLGFVVLFFMFGFFGDVFASIPHLTGTITEGTVANYNQTPYPVHNAYNWYQGTYPTADELCSYGSSGTTTQAIIDNATINLEIRLQPTACEGNGDYFDIIDLDGTPVGYFTYERVSSTEWQITSCDTNCGMCETHFTCQNVGCCWYYSTWLHENYCVPCPTGECNSSFYECQNCLTQGTCEAEETCYWYNGLCKFGLGTCGEGFDCEFCNTSSTCATQNCYWFEDFCWQFEPPAVTSWFDYYSEFGDYPTSSAFVNQMASTTGIVFGSIGSFLSGFVEAFDTSEALAQGENFGSAIPKMRGFLAIFNEFFGELPVAQAFLFLITFLLAVGLFRLVRNLIALFKFW